MAEKKVSAGLFPKSQFPQPHSVDFWKDRIYPHQLKVSRSGGVSSRVGFSFPGYASAPWSVNLCPNFPQPFEPSPGGLAGQWHVLASYMDFMPLAVVPSGSPSPTAAVSCSPE
jgi:hypothetical protein